MELNISWSQPYISRQNRKTKLKLQQEFNRIHKIILTQKWFWNFQKSRTKWKKKEKIWPNIKYKFEENDG